MKFISYIFCLLLLLSCNTTPTAVALPKKAEPKDSIQLGIDNLKNMAEEGDLIVRLGDDMLSYSIKFLSETDHSYSHAGIIVKEGSQKKVLHITPDTAVHDLIQSIAIDSFIDPKKNLVAGLYRFQLSSAEKALFLERLHSYEKQGVKFDRKYDVKTDNYLYCSELIAKSLATATNNTVMIRQSQVPRNMLPLMYAYFQKDSIPKKRLQQGKYITIDNLYRNGRTTELVKLQLREPQ
jgi:hypothetical protein